MNQTQATEEVANALSRDGIWDSVGILTPLEEHKPPTVLCRFKGTVLSVTVEILAQP